MVSGPRLEPVTSTNTIAWYCTAKSCLMYSGGTDCIQAVIFHHWLLQAMCPSHRHSLDSATRAISSTVSFCLLSPLLFVSAAISISYVAFLEETTAMLAIFTIWVPFYTQLSETMRSELRMKQSSTPLGSGDTQNCALCFGVTHGDERDASALKFHSWVLKKLH